MTSTSLEQLVVRIHQLLEPEGASVVWNPKNVRDPDTGRIRQIDGMIHREGKCVHIECRAHAEPQDVTWVEELIGRRISLEADGIIAISCSGFTEPAQKKANRFGIFLRTLQDLSDAEIDQWAKPVSVVANYVEIAEASIRFAVDDQQARHLPSTPVLRTEQDKTDIDPRLAIIEKTLLQAGCHFYEDKVTTAIATLPLSGLLLGSVPVLWAKVKLVGTLRRERISVLGQWSYKEPMEPSANSLSDAVVANYKLGHTEIIQSMDIASLSLDLSNVVVPAGCFPYVWQVDFDQVIKARVNFIGKPSLSIAGIRFLNSLVGVAVG